MRKLIPLLLPVAVCACQPKVAVPTAQELIGNRALLAQWQAKCDTGEYSQLPADQKNNLCATTQDATVSVGQMQAGKADADFFKANTRRK